MLSKKNFILCVFFAITLFSFSQEEQHETPVYPDYKNTEQYKKHYKTRHVVSEWQINELKKGALVVRLKTNRLQINALINSGQKRLAEQKRLELLARNLNMYFAYKEKYNFSKLYFIYNTSSDAMLKGERQNIFLDSNLVVDSSIVMNESFYLFAETDNLYNSSIGFVKEEDAQAQIEHGTKTTTEALVVLKNKYGHQLKKPFPYRAYEPPPLKTPFYVYLNAAPIINKYFGIENKNQEVYLFENEPLDLQIEANFSDKNYSRYVGNINAILFKYYEKTGPVNISDIDPQIRPFLY